ncbi:hypothetical protein AAFC00_003818 [Neodothiora populina]|uniref:Glucose-methanol-choline oxidoreductase N-terminal domain-containing protein n=1 Tax=Neodothiora populina TaxID=2781224 RepID=A0ABR3PGP3_9PEZI
MVRFSIASTALYALGAVAQSFSYTDSKSGITFQSWKDSKTGCQYGISMPETIDTDFIAQIVAPVTDDKGWAGFDLGATMTGPLLVVAWPNSGEVVASFRKAGGYVTPPVYSGNGVSMMPIEKGTFVNSTHFSYTFLCRGCITGDSLSFPKTSSGSVFGWAYSDAAVTNPSSQNSALSYHSAGFGEFDLNFTSARSAQYSTWAAMASVATTSSGNNTTGATGSNSTVSAANVTATVSNVTYDYIIAGSGPAGIIVADRIAETGASVLLLERGGASTYASGGRSVMSWNNTVTQYDVPAMGYYLTSSNDTSEYCTDTASMAGCLLGGSTMVNALMFVHPQEIDFDDKWPTGWKWQDVASSAEKLYQRNPGTISPSADGHRYDQAAYDVLSQFFSNNGWSSVNALEQPNEKHNVFSHPPWNIQNGLRAGPVMTYLPHAQQFPNFKLQLHTKVIRAVRNGSYVSGVEVEGSKGARQIIKVNPGGKVILSSGSLSTPRVLFNSGIGPAAQIQTVQSGSTAVTLPSKAEWINLPVGQGIKDHPIITLKFKTNSAIRSLYQNDFLVPALNETAMFAHGNGALVQAGQRFNFWTSVKTSDGSTRYVQGTCNSPSTGVVKIKVYLTHGVTSTGVLGITADGATELTTAPYLNTAMDKEAMSGFIDQLIAYSKTANSTLTYVPSTTSGNETGADLLSTYVSGSHFVGSAKMGTDDGRKNNGTSVVDLNTKVYGTDNLFVVDASFHPDLPTGNTQAIVMVAAEAAAAKILALGGSNSTAAPASSSVGSAAAYAASSAAAPYHIANATSVTAAATGTSVPHAAVSSAIASLTATLPAGALTSEVSVPTASAIPGHEKMKPIPKGFTMMDILEWIDYLFDEEEQKQNQGAAGVKRRHARDIIDLSYA